MGANAAGGSGMERGEHCLRLWRDGCPGVEHGNGCAGRERPTDVRERLHVVASIPPAVRAIDLSAILSQMAARSRGAFVVLEGGDGSGKTSVLEALRRQFPEAVVTREPGGSPYGEAIRSVLLTHPQASEADGMTHLLLHYAARRDHLRTVVIPALVQGKLVLCDRFAASSWAYNVRAQECDACAELFPTLHQYVVGSWEPDLYLWLAVAPEEARKRRTGGGNHYDARDAAFHTRVYEGYEEFFERYRGKVVRIDAAQPLFRVIEQATGAIQAHLHATQGRMV